MQGLLVSFLLTLMLSLGARSTEVVITFSNIRSAPDSSSQFNIDASVDQITCNILNSLKPGTCLDASRVKTVFVVGKLPEFLDGRSMVFSNAREVGFVSTPNSNWDSRLWHYGLCATLTCSSVVARYDYQVRVLHTPLAGNVARFVFDNPVKGFTWFTVETYLPRLETNVTAL